MYYAYAKKSEVRETHKRTFNIILFIGTLNITLFIGMVEVTIFRGRTRRLMEIRSRVWYEYDRMNSTIALFYPILYPNLSP